MTNLTFNSGSYNKCLCVHSGLGGFQRNLDVVPHREKRHAAGSHRTHGHPPQSVQAKTAQIQVLRKNDIF